MKKYLVLTGLLFLTMVSNGAPLLCAHCNGQAVNNTNSFRALRAERKGTAVQLQWTTEKEINIRGYIVERYTGSEWLNVGFVPALSADDISATQRNYIFTDFSAGSGALLYRLVQRGVDHSQLISSSLQVGPQGAAPSVTIYPNPSRGNFTVLLDGSMGLQNVFLADMAGRMIAIYRDAAQSIEVKDLMAGTYVLRIVDNKTGRQLTEKVVVQ